MREVKRLLHVALAGAFNEPELDQLLHETFTQHLRDIASQGAMPDMVGEVIDWAERRRLIPILVGAVAEARPLRPEVKDMVRRLAQLAMTAPAIEVGSEVEAVSNPDNGNSNLERTVRSLVIAIRGDPDYKRSGLIEEVQNLSRQVAELDRRMKNRWLPWIIALIGLGMAIVERFF